MSYPGIEINTVVPTITGWTSFPMTINGSSSDPTKATSPTVDSAFWRRVGEEMEIRYTLRSTGSGAVVGSGVYLFLLPNSKVIDNTKITVSTSLGRGACGSALVGLNAFNAVGTVKVYDTTHVMVMYCKAASVSYMNHTDTPMTDSDFQVSFQCSVPISGWGISG